MSLLIPVRRSFILDIQVEILIRFILPTEATIFDYYLSVVPTIYVDATGALFDSVVLTNQYAVTEFHRNDPQRMLLSGLPGTIDLLTSVDV